MSPSRSVTWSMDGSTPKHVGIAPKVEKPILKNASHGKSSRGSQRHKGNSILVWAARHRAQHEVVPVQNTSDNESWRKYGQSHRATLIRKDEEAGGNAFDINSSCKVEQYFVVAERVLNRFLETRQSHREELSENYLVGQRLLKFLSVVLPTHPNYFAEHPQVWEHRNKSQQYLVQLLQYLDVLAKLIDEEQYNKFIISDLNSKVAVPKKELEPDKRLTKEPSGCDSLYSEDNKLPSEESFIGGLNISQQASPSMPKEIYSADLSMVHSPDYLATSLEYSMSTGAESEDEAFLLFEEPKSLLNEPASDQDNSYFNLPERSTAPDKDHRRSEELASMWDNSFLLHLEQNQDSGVIEKPKQSKKGTRSAPPPLEHVLEKTPHASQEKLCARELPTNTPNCRGYLPTENVFALINQAPKQQQHSSVDWQPNNPQDLFQEDTIDFTEFQDWRKQQKEFEEKHYATKFPSNSFQTSFKKPSNEQCPHSHISSNQQDFSSPKSVFELQQWQSDETLSTDPSSQGSRYSNESVPQSQSMPFANFRDQCFEGFQGQELSLSQHPLCAENSSDPSKLSSEPWSEEQITQKIRGRQMKYFKDCIKCLIE